MRKYPTLWQINFGLSSLLLILLLVTSLQGGMQSLALPFMILALLGVILTGVIAFAAEKFMHKPIQTTHAWLQIYAKAVHTTADDFLIMSAGGVIEFMNPAAVRNMSGAGRGAGSDEQLLGRDLWSHIEDAELALQIKETVLDQKTWRGEIVFRPKSEPDARFIIEEATFSPVLNDDGVLEHITLIKHNIQVKKHYEHLIQRMAHYNALTQLPNRSLLRSQLEEVIASDKSRSVTVYMLSVNNFKFINDTVGHEAGDQLLQRIAEKLQNAFQDAFCVANTHGDVFALVLNHLDDHEAISGLVHERLLPLFSQPFVIKKREYNVSVAVGASVYPVDGVKADAILQCAETAMYAAKSLKNNSFLRFDITFFQAIERRLSLERELRQALGRQEFILYYQPKVDGITRKISGSEALIRWCAKDRFMMPGQFIPLAEEIGLIVPITWFVLEEACRQTRVWHDQGFTQLNVAVNVSAQVLLEDDFSERVEGVLEKTGLPPECLRLEITEESLLDDRVANNALLKSLRTKGIQVAIDDFGTGYSSLLYLKELSLDEIKLDRIFIAGIPDNTEDMVIVQATMNMAHALGMRVVAEGVETKKQMETLTHLYCNEFQGSYYSPPVSGEDFQKLLEAEQMGGTPGQSEFHMGQVYDTAAGNENVVTLSDIL
ncbi:MAG: EAL domain-containing protein [Peptococcaceae bacterium]|nr:EAL domain-containing protein [Peptococcaceae bacterium]